MDEVRLNEKVYLKIESCVECPYIAISRNYTEDYIDDSFEYVTKWFCNKLEKYVRRYAETHDEPARIPVDCPLRDVGKEETKVFVVTIWKYEASTLGIFSSMEMAEEFMKTYPNSEYNEVREWILDEKLNTDLCHFNICIDKDGEVIEIYKFLSLLNWYPGFIKYDANLLWRVQTPEEEKAIEFVNEKREIILAQGIWGDEFETIKLFHPDRIGECGHALRSNYWCMKCQKYTKREEDV